MEQLNFEIDIKIDKTDLQETVNYLLREKIEELITSEIREQIREVVKEHVRTTAKEKILEIPHKDMEELTRETLETFDSVFVEFKRHKRQSFPSVGGLYDES